MPPPVPLPAGAGPRRVPPPSPTGLVFDVDTFAVHDGPGIRMAVYFKGCPLACRWCHSPESQAPERELVFVRDRCVGCGACAEVCAHGVHTLSNGDHAIGRERCVACGACVERCPTGALAVKGYRVAARRIVEGAARLAPFFRHSGGGVTLTGGEVTAQADFAVAVLAGLRERGIHAAIETCGACPWETLERVASLADLVLYDLKLIDDAAHRAWTGASNTGILANARRLAETCPEKVEVRVPLVPGVTDTEANLGGLFAFLADAGLGRATLLPYNASAGAKYEWLGRAYELAAEPHDAATLEGFLATARDAGLEARLG